MQEGWFGIGGVGSVANDNPFYPKVSNLARFLAAPERPTNALADYTSPAVSDLFGALSSPSPLANPYGAAASDLFGSGLSPSTAPPTPFGALYPPAPAPYAPPSPLKPVAPAVKRKAFFSFHWDDIIRVNVIRNAWKITHPDNATMRGFYDSSLWESRMLEGDEAIKRLIREGVCYTSAVCVLAGSGTWERRWVRYEIARAIVDGRGLLTVHLNSIRHHVTRTPHTRGGNPLSFMAIGKVQADVWQPVRYYLFENRRVSNGVGGWEWGWYRYDDYTLPVDLPGWMADPKPGFVTPLSDGSAEYDYIADNGHRNIGSWIDIAAKRAGR
jgi:hypothetical protein